jgi:hypothetical protein
MKGLYTTGLLTKGQAALQMQRTTNLQNGMRESSGDGFAKFGMREMAGLSRGIVVGRRRRNPRRRKAAE